MATNITNVPFCRDVSPVQQKVQLMGPTHFYRCRETGGNLLIDSSGNNRNGIITTSKDKTNFNGSYLRLRGNLGEYATLPSTGLFNDPNSTGFSLMLWVSISDIESRDQWYRILEMSSSNTNSGQPSNTFQFTKRMTDNSVFSSWSNSSWNDIGVGVNFGDLLPDTWYHLSITFRNLDMIAYINGQMVGQATLTGAPTVADRPWLFLGKASCLTDPATYITASYKDVAFFNYEISANDIAEVYDLSVSNTKIYGVATSDSIPPVPAKAVLVRSLPSNETTLCHVDQTTGYWEAYVSKDHVYDVTAYGQDGSVYKPQIFGPMEI